MKIKYVILTVIFASISSYIVGQLVPLELLRPNITDKSISMNDYYTRLISLIGAAVTIFATLVALFKEDIKRLYEYASLDVLFKDEGIIIEVLDSEDSNSSPVTNANLSAKKFEVSLSVHNKGKLVARGCQIYLEQLVFESATFPAPKNIQTSGKPIQWMGKTDLATVIPSTAKTHVNIVEIFSPQSELVTSDNSSKNSTKAKIKIAGIDLPLDSLHGKYTCGFMIYSENAQPAEFKIEITWNGKWQHRLTEMKECVTIVECKKNKK